MPVRMAGLLVFLLAGCAAAIPVRPGAISPGYGQQQADIAGTELKLFTYRPADCRPRLLLLVFHGTDRRAGAYRDHAVPLADRSCAVVVAPEFDQARFPRALYQYGGVTREAPGKRTIDLVPPLIAWARGAADGPDLPVVLLGHSAGAQFLGRVAAFVPTGAAGIVLANPSTWVLPRLETEAPYGFGGTEQATGDAVRAYLARPITVLLGTADTGDHQLATGKAAMAQGPNRLAAGPGRPAPRGARRRKLTVRRPRRPVRTGSRCRTAARDTRGNRCRA